MPLIRIYHPAERSFRDPKDRKGLADKITDIYTAAGLPAFYVIVLFVPLPSDYVFVGGRSDERGNADANEKPLIRVCFDHIARAFPDIQTAKGFFNKVDDALKPYVADKGYEWEYHVTESKREYSKVNGKYLPPTGSDAEIRWAKENRTSDYAGMDEPSPLPKL
ncbi:Tautomerase [Macrophomina phaseolina MS6]|uniref:Tautomerase n=2 Tax=Macrophomina phaseolina TaxID=35725 RepID=K2SXS2_MACPH|nr:Tautomerase [Macrophomina phaseolina MS6]KAH7058648.1 putative oxalocrotonate tautomerase [Macrophomina phaseolina]